METISCQIARRWSLIKSAHHHDLTDKTMEEHYKARANVLLPPLPSGSVANFISNTFFFPLRTMDCFIIFHLFSQSSAQWAVLDHLEESGGQFLLKRSWKFIVPKVAFGIYKKKYIYISVPELWGRNGPALLLRGAGAQRAVSRNRAIRTSLPLFHERETTMPTTSFLSLLTEWQ